MIYPGRILSKAAQSDKTLLWNSSKLVSDGRTDFAQQLKPSEMDEIESLNPESLPSTTDEGAFVQGLLRSVCARGDGALAMGQ
jgi:hypothetical protein